jgi:hypothetical protein
MNKFHEDKISSTYIRDASMTFHCTDMFVLDLEKGGNCN